MRPNKVFLLTNNQEVRKKIWCEPSVSKAEALGFEMLINESDKELTKDEWAEWIADALAVVTTWGSPRLTKDVLAKNTQLKIVGHAAGTVAPYVSPELFARGVRVTTANPLMARTVAEAGVMLMLMGLRQAHKNTQLGTRSEAMAWDERRLGGIRVVEDVTLGIWGYGEIAKWLVRLLKPFDPREILVSSGHLDEDTAKREGINQVDFNDLFCRAEVIFVLAGMTEANRGRIGRRQLQRICDDALLINLGRAHLIQREPLIEELRKGRFTGVLDVFHEEPLPDGDPLLSMPNVILTPHNAGAGRYGHYVSAMLEEIDRFFRDEPLKFEVSPERVAQMTDPAAMR